MEASPLINVNVNLFLFPHLIFRVGKTSLMNQYPFSVWKPKKQIESESLLVFLMSVIRSRCIIHSKSWVLLSFPLFPFLFCFVFPTSLCKVTTSIGSIWVGSSCFGIHWFRSSWQNIIGCLTTKISRVNEVILHIDNIFSVVISILIWIYLKTIAQIGFLSFLILNLCLTNGMLP